MIDEKPVCHTGLIPFPLRKGWVRVHRLVVLPDYQGIGIGTKFIEEVARKIEKEGLRLNLTTTTPALVHKLCRSKKWALARYGRVAGTMNKMLEMKHLQQSTSARRITYSFNYKKQKKK
jgi:GNAT superfamily N-acetyltransferase